MRAARKGKKKYETNRQKGDRALAIKEPKGHKKRRDGTRSHESPATPPTTSHSEDDDDRSASQAVESSMPPSGGASRNTSQTTGPVSVQEKLSDNEMCPTLETAFREEPDGRNTCLHCGRYFSIKSGPSTLKYHLTKGCRVLVHHTQKPVLTEEHANMLVCTLIAEDCFPLSLTENSNLRALCDYLRPGYKPPCRTTLTKKQLPKIKVALKKAMQAKLDTIDFVSISFDGWTSDASQNYIGILCHGITPNWTLETFLLDVVPVSESETAEYIAKMVKRVLKKWDALLKQW